MQIRPLPVLSFFSEPNSVTPTSEQSFEVGKEQRSNAIENSTEQKATFGPRSIHGRVTESLLRLEANETVFDKRDTELLDLRGVSTEDRQQFKSIIERARNENAFANPVKFVNSLSAKETEVLQRIHGFASPHSVKKTNIEGAINVLLPPNSAVDFNNDSIVQTGASRGFRFPPPNAPDVVHEAWEKATAGLSLKEKAIAQLPFVSLAFSANVQFNDAGEFVRLVEPGSPDFTNPYPQDLEGWSNFTFDKAAEYRAGAERDPAMTTVADQLETFRGVLSQMIGQST